MQPHRILRLASLQSLGHLLRVSAQQWAHHRASSKGAALALYMVFSLAPLLILVIALAGAFVGEEVVQTEIFGQLSAWMGERNAELIRTVLTSAKESGQGGLAAFLSILILLFSATTAFAELKSSLDELWEVKETGGLQGLLRSRLLAFGLVLVLAFFLLSLLVISTLLAAARAYYGTLWSNPMGATTVQWLSQLFSFGVMTLLFAVVFKLLPDANIAWRHVLPGALLTTALFFLGKWGIGRYLSWSGAASTYGAAGSFIALLLWIYYSAQIFFFGAIFTHQYGQRAARLANRPTL